jgi:putative ABC transport system permease protein
VTTPARKGINRASDIILQMTHTSKAAPSGMSLFGLALKDVFRNSFRSCAVVLCSLLVAGFCLATFLIVGGVGDSLELAQRRFGADVVVVPEGAERETKGALLMGVPMKAWMPITDAAEIAKVPGVALASPQLYLATLENSTYSSAPAMFLVAYDPASDFTIGPWLAAQMSGNLAFGQSLGGSLISAAAENGPLMLYGYELSLNGSLDPTGTILDQSLFVTFETARDILGHSTLEAEQDLSVPADSASSVLVKIAPGFDIKQVAADIREKVPGVSPITSPDLFGSFRDQMQGQRAGMLTILGVVLALSLAIILLIFSMVVNERRREIGVLRALGATRGGVLRSLLTSAAVLALSGGAAGIILSGLVLYFFRNALTNSFGFPFLFPSLPSFILLVVIGLAVALGCVLLAAFAPAYRISRQDPAMSMRE